MPPPNRAFSFPRPRRRKKGKPTKPGYKKEKNFVKISEVRKHCKKDDCWIIIHGRVYDITDYVKVHPGGEKMILLGAGRDGTLLFHKFHGYINHKYLLQDKFIGLLKN